MTKKDKGGRPTILTPETISKLEYAFSIGCTDEEACLHANIGRSTLYNYQNKNPKFVDRKELLKSRPVLMARNNVIDRINNKDADMSKWYLERKKKQEFSTRQESTGADGNAIQSHQEISFKIEDAKKFLEELKEEM